MFDCNFIKKRLCQYVDKNSSMVSYLVFKTSDDEVANLNIDIGGNKVMIKDVEE